MGGRAQGPGIRLGEPEDPRPRVDVGPPFRRLNGGWLALDYVNTVPGWVSSPERRGGRDWGDGVAGERLERYGDLVAWSRLEGVLGVEPAAALEAAAGSRPGEAGRVMARARALRSSLFRLFRASVEGWAALEEDVGRVNRELGRLRRREVLVARGAAYGVEWVSEEAVLESLLWPPLRSALALLTDAEMLERVGQCGGPGCGWLFVDVGRGRGRRWCDSRDCGNVAKVRAYRRRQSS